MKSEAEFCTIVNHSLICGNKIPDPSSAFSSTTKRCFDGIGMLELDGQLRFVCWEAKFLKRPMAFNFKRIEEHQSYYLSEYKKSGITCLLIVCVDYGRSDKRVFIFDWDDKMNNLYKEGFSIHLKKLNCLPYNKIEKKQFKFDNIITYEDLLKI